MTVIIRQNQWQKTMCLPCFAKNKNCFKGSPGIGAPHDSEVLDSCILKISRVSDKNGFTEELH